jgi:hypothetical protein
MKNQWVIIPWQKTFMRKTEQADSCPRKVLVFIANNEFSINIGLATTAETTLFERLMYTLIGIFFIQRGEFPCKAQANSSLISFS